MPLRGYDVRREARDMATRITIILEERGDQLANGRKKEGDWRGD